MKRTKKLLVGLLACLSVLCGSLGLAACGDGNESSSSSNGSSVEQSSGSNVFSQGLEYTLLSNDTYEVSGVGDCTDTELVIPNSYNGKTVTSIGGRAFCECESLTSIVIPNSVTSIGTNAFYDCDSLTGVYISSVEAWCNISFGESTADPFKRYSSNPLSYAKNLYLNNELVTCLEITNTVTEIKNGVFWGCSSLTRIEIPDSVESIGEEAFWGCDSLTSIEISDSVESIGDRAFLNCSSLTSVTIGNSVTSIGNGVFWGCDNLTYNAKDNLKYLGNERNPYLYLAGVSDTSIASATIESSCKLIGFNAFYNCDVLTSIEIPDSVTSIGYGAFRGCSSLEYNVKNNLQYLGNEQNPYLYLAGVNDTSIANATIESTCKLIGDDAFYDCDSLTSIEIPDSVTSIGVRAFYWCSSLTSVYITDIEAWCNISFGDITASAAENLYLNNELVTELEIPNTITEIKDYAFYGCDSLTSIVIPDSVTSIDRDAFAYCSSLTSITMGNGVTSIGDDAFSGCGKLTSIEIPDSVTSIGNGAFYNCSSLTNIEIPDSVTSIGKEAFYGCESLTSITFNGTIEEWNAIEKGSSWRAYVPATKVVCSDGEVAL